MSQGTERDHLDPVSYRTASLDETRALFDEYYYPLDINVRGPVDGFAFGLDVVQLGPVTVGDLTFGAEMSVDAANDLHAYQFNMPVSGRMEIRQHGDIAQLQPGTAGGYQPLGPVRQPFISADCRLLAVKIEQGALEHELEALLGHPIHEPLRLPLGNDLSTGAGRSLARLLWLVRAELADREGLIHHPLVASRLWHGVLTGLLLATSHQYRDELAEGVPPPRPRTVKRAIDAMESEPERPFTVTSLAAIAGTSVRTLQEGFRRHVGVSPMVYLRRLRLARAHADLRAADPRRDTVASVACRWGFVHLGRFARAYRAEYGCSPAEALRMQP
jgi:AraC-like DNA-binding protein